MRTLESETCQEILHLSFWFILMIKYPNIIKGDKENFYLQIR